MRFLAAIQNPSLALGAFTFTNSRRDFYRTLHEFLADKGAAVTLNIQSQIGHWSKRDRERGEQRYLVYDYISSRMANGDSFANALRPFIPNDEYLILHAAHISGDLVQALELVMANMGRVSEMRSALFTAIALPAGGFMLLVVMSVWYGLSVWPVFLNSIPLKYWPDWAQPAITFQTWLSHNLWAVGVLMLTVPTYYATTGSWIGTARHWADKIPPWSLYKARQAGNLLNVLAALIASGKTTREALSIIADNGTEYMQSHIHRILARFQLVGADPIKALDTGLFSRDLLDHIEDAARTRDFDKTLAFIGHTSAEGLMRIMKRQAMVVSSASMLFVGIFYIYLTAVTAIATNDAMNAMSAATGG